MDLILSTYSNIAPNSLVNLENVVLALQPMIEDELVIIEQRTIRLTATGIPFVRNCCMAFDAHLTALKPTQPTFSLTV